MNYTSDEMDALTEVVNIGVGRAAAALSDLIGDRIVLSVPRVTFSTLNQIRKEAAEPHVDLDTSVIQDFEGPTSGRAVLAFPQSSALKLGQILADLDETPEELDFDLQDVLNEVGNIVLNGVLGSLSNLLHDNLQYTVPTLSQETSLAQLVKAQLSDEPGECSDDNRPVLVADAHFNVATRNISGSLLLLFDEGGIKAITDSLLGDEVSV